MSGGPLVAPPSISPHTHWNNHASTNAEAVALASTTGLEFPTTLADWKFSLVKYPIRRLIMTGQDTDVNFAKLLGPQWEQCRGTIDKTRIKVLLDPEPGSVAHRRSKRFDRGCPGRTPRIPTQEEEAILRAANDLKAQTLDSLRKKGNRDKRNQDFRDFILGNQEFLTHSSWAFDAAMDGVKGFKRNKKTDFWEKFRRGWAQLWSEKT